MSSGEQNMLNDYGYIGKTMRACWFYLDKKGK